MPFNHYFIKPGIVIKSTALASLALVLSACDSDEKLTLKALTAEDVSAVIATVAPDYSIGAHSVVGLGSLQQPVNELLPTDKSDIRVVSHGRHFYRIERFAADNITKFDIDAPATPVWQYSTITEAEKNAGLVSSNPHDLVFASDSKAYLLRYGSDSAWIVNPAATTEAEFKIGELDLSAYADEDGSPEMTRGVIVGNKLFILMQRQASWIPGEAYIAVFNTDTDTEISTGASNTLGVSGIALPSEIRNPLNMQYLEDTGMVYVQAVGEWPGFTDAVYDGGIVSLDPDTFDIATLLDDGDSTTHPYGNISAAIMVSADTGFFVGYAGWGDNTLYRFNPETGVVAATVYSSLQNINIADLAVDPLGQVWIGNASSQGINILDPATDTVSANLISTVLNPLNITFVVK